MIGNQVPRIDIYQPGDTEMAELLLELLDEYGTHLFEWQRLVLRRWLAYDARTKKLKNLTCGLSVPRQNGKTELIVARIIFGIIFRHATGIFTAQQVKTAKVVLKRVQDFFYDNPHEEIFNLLSPRFRAKPRNYEFIEFEFPNGDSCVYHFLTRTRLGGLGMTADELINDEAADMADTHEDTLRPIVSASKKSDPQVIYCGTPPMAESVGEVFPRFRRKMLGGEKGVWTEWGVEFVTDPSDKKAWAQANPSLGLSLLEAAIEAESVSLTVDGFNRMRLGWWAGIEDKRAIPQTMWDKCKVTKPLLDETYRPVYAIKFAPDRSMYCLAAALPHLNEPDKIHVEIVISRAMNDGTNVLTKWLVPRWRDSSAIIIDGTTGASILLEDLRSVGVAQKRLILPMVKDVIDAHEFMFTALKQQQFTHFDQPLLNQAVRVTKTRPIGRLGGFGWETMNRDISTCPLDAATLAFWGAKKFIKKKLNDSETPSSEKIRKILAGL